MTYGRQTQLSAKPTELWPIDWAINQVTFKQDINRLLQAIHQPCQPELCKPKQPLKPDKQPLPKMPQHSVPGTFKPNSLTLQQSLLLPPLQQSTSTLAKQTTQLTGANFKHLDPLVLKPPHPKAAPSSKLKPT